MTVTPDNDVDERHDPRCAKQPCTCAKIAQRVRDEDAARARAIIRGER